MSKQKTILIVEDELILQDVYRLVLSKSGYAIHTAYNGVDGLRKMKKIKPDLVLLDIFMPLMDGKEFLRNLDMAEYPHTKIIVYTNMYDKATEKEMASLGADAFVLKSSMTPSDLVTIVEQYLGPVS